MHKQATSLRKTLAAQVKSRRDALGWSQEKLAEEAGTSQVYVSQLENAKRGISIDVLEKLAHALGVKAGDLLGK